MEYERYIRSEAWRCRREAFFFAHKRRCRACGATHDIQLHHKTYIRMGQEPDKDLVPVCQACHSEIHDLHRRRSGHTLEWATNQLIKQKQRQKQQVPPYKPARQRKKPILTEADFATWQEAIKRHNSNTRRHQGQA